jgi:hypothetical protein
MLAAQNATKSAAVAVLLGGSKDGGAGADPDGGCGGAVSEEAKM